MPRQSQPSKISSTPYQRKGTERVYEVKTCRYGCGHVDKGSIRTRHYLDPKYGHRERFYEDEKAAGGRKATNVIILMTMQCTCNPEKTWGRADVFVAHLLRKATCEPATKDPDAKKYWEDRMANRLAKVVGVDESPSPPLAGSSSSPSPSSSHHTDALANIPSDTAGAEEASTLQFIHYKPEHLEQPTTDSMADYAAHPQAVEPRPAVHPQNEEDPSIQPGGYFDQHPLPIIGFFQQSLPVEQRDWAPPVHPTIFSPSLDSSQTTPADTPSPQLSQIYPDFRSQELMMMQRRAPPEITQLPLRYWTSEGEYLPAGMAPIIYPWQQHASTAPRLEPSLLQTLYADTDDELYAFGLSQSGIRRSMSW